jgi:hypothetical protein
MNQQQPTNADLAINAGYLIAPENYDGKVEYGRYRQWCERHHQPIISITPRRTYAAIDVQLPDGEELSPGLALYVLRILHHHHSPGRVRINSVLIQRVPIGVAEDVARKIAQLAS